MPTVLPRVQSLTVEKLSTVRSAELGVWGRPSEFVRLICRLEVGECLDDFALCHFSPG